MSGFWKEVSEEDEEEKKLWLEKNRTMDITMYSAQQRKLFQEVFGKLNVNGFAIGAVKHRKENPTCQDIINQKNARRYLEGATTNVHEAM